MSANSSVNRTLTRYAGSRPLPQALGVIKQGVEMYLGFGFAIFVTGVWCVVIILLFRRFSGRSLSQQACRGVGYTAIALGCGGAALMQLVKGEIVAANLLANLMLSFSSAAGGVYLSKGYLA